jgi:hypothetical protein
MYNSSGVFWYVCQYGFIFLSINKHITLNIAVVPVRLFHDIMWRRCSWQQGSGGLTRSFFYALYTFGVLWNLNSVYVVLDAILRFRLNRGMKISESFRKHCSSHLKGERICSSWWFLCINLTTDIVWKVIGLRWTVTLTNSEDTLHYCKDEFSFLCTA